MDQAILAEYNNLWQEKLQHSAELKRFRNYLNYLIPTGSVALAVGGARIGDIGETLVSETTSVGLVEFLALLVVPLAVVLPLVGLFMTQELFHVHVIGRYITQVENRLARDAAEPPMRWESVMSAAVYYGEVKPGEKPIKNPIEYNAWLSGILGIIVYGGSLIAAPILLSELFSGAWEPIVLTVFLGVSAFLLVATIRILLLNRTHTRPDSLLEQRIESRYWEGLRPKDGRDKTE